MQASKTNIGRDSESKQKQRKLLSIVEDHVMKDQMRMRLVESGWFVATMRELTSTYSNTMSNVFLIRP